MYYMYLRDDALLQGGKYKIVRFISAGGFGCTYEAEHVMLHKRVAIKEFFVKDFCNRDETTSQISVGITSKTALVDKLKKKFIEEAQSLCALEHPNIVHVFDVFEENGTAYYVMDYIDGPSLNDLVKKDGPMSEQKALGYIKQVADALKYVHSRNRLHLDIKPGNIMVDEKDRAILIDFGASKQYDEEAGENTSTLLGKTPGYAPLEQMGNDVVKFLPSTDIYALGATLYKLLTGVTPPSATLLASGETLEEMPSNISVCTRNAIIQSMQTNKMKRPQNTKEFENLLAGDVDERTIIEEPVEPTPQKVQERKTHPQNGTKKTVKNDSVKLEEDSDEKSLPELPKEKLGFWLWTFLIVLCYCGMASILAALASDTSNEVLAGCFVLFAIMQTILAFHTMRAFRRRKSDAVFLGKLSLLVICLSDLFYLLSFDNGATGIAEIAPLVRGIVTAIIWFVYLCVSKRVEAVIPSATRRTLKKDYIICAVLAIFSIYFAVATFAVSPTAQKLGTLENTNGNRVVNKKFQDSEGETFTYTGEVVNGKPNGIGEGVYSYGRYVGPYKNGLMHGADGKFTEKGGATFVGSFDKDYYNEGRLTRSDGTYFEGKMKDGVPYKGTEYYKSGKVKKQL